MKTIAIAAAAVFTYIAGGMAQASPAKTQLPNTKGVAAFIESFDSMAEFLEGMTRLGLIRSEEQKVVLQVLEKNGVPAATKPSKANVSASRITWGKTSLAIQADGSFKTNRGTTIKLPKGQSFEKIFTEALRALSNQKTASFSEIIVNSAHASQADVFDAMTGAVFTATYHVFKAAYTVGNLAGAAATNVAGIPLEYTLVGLHNLIHKDTVVCTPGGNYLMHGGYQMVDWMERFDYWEKVAQEKQDKYPDSLASAIGGYSTSLTAAFMTGADLLGSAYNPKEKLHEISEKALRLAWPEGKSPQCTKETAAKLEAALKGQAKKIEAQIQTGMQGSSSAPATAPVQ